GVDDAALVDDVHGSATLSGYQDAVPLDAAGASFAEACDYVAADGPGEFAAQLAEGAVGVYRILRHGLAQLAQQLFETGLLAAEFFEVLGVGVGLGVEVGEHRRAPHLLLLDLAERRALLGFQVRQLRVLRGELGVQLVYARHIAFNRLDFL